MTARCSEDVYSIDFEDCGFETGLPVLAGAPGVGGRLRPDLHLLAAASNRAPPLEVGDILSGAEIPPRGDADVAGVGRVNDDASVADRIGGDHLVEAGKIGPVDGSRVIRCERAHR